MMIEMIDPQNSQLVPSLTIINRHLPTPCATPSSTEMSSSCSPLINSCAYNKVMSPLSDSGCISQKLSQTPSHYLSFQVFPPRRRQLRIFMHTRLLLVLLLATIQITSSLQRRQERCSCTPRIYRWRLDFTQPCFLKDHSFLDGVEESRCKTFLSNATHTHIPGSNDDPRSQPEFVISYKIIEFGKTFDDQVNLAYVTYDGVPPLSNGDVITFDSITNSDSYIYTSGLSIHMTGENYNGERVELSLIIRYDNTCRSKPYEEGIPLGWLVFENFIPARDRDCLRGQKSKTKSKKADKSKIAKSSKAAKSKKSKTSKKFKL